MTRPIQAGDLVQVVKPTICCGNGHSLGDIYIVEEVQLLHSHCPHCGAIKEKSLLAMRPDGYGHQLARLKRINPLEELEGQRTQEDIREPA